MSSAKLAVGVRSAALLLLAPAAALTAQLGNPIRLTEQRVIGPDVVELADVTSAMLGPEGQLLLTDATELRLVLIAPDGAVRKIGRNGEGPGEFKHLSAVYGDSRSFWARDIRQERVQQFDWNGRLLGAAKYSGNLTVPGTTDGMFVVPVGASPRGGMLISGSAPSSAVSTGPLAAVKPGAEFVAGIDSIGNMLRVVASVDRTTDCTRATEDGFAIQLPFCIGSKISISSDGRTVVSLQDLNRGERTARMRVAMTGVDGRRILDSTLRFERRAVTREEFGAIRDQVVERSKSRSPTILTLFDAQPASSFYHAFNDMKVLDDGTAWIRVNHRGGTGQDWLVIGGDGRVVGVAALKAGERPIAGGRTSVWTRQADDDGWQVLTQYRL